mmetsp:Transcript_7611/g.8813  ORF Transcript_7611/g.8813 Transcript_7611/m.8813 type:complete len:907 (-) Transcript_7611:452-3172(-)
MTSEAQQRAIAIIPKFSAFFSVIGSGFIIYDIICSHFEIKTTFWKKYIKCWKDDNDEIEDFAGRMRSNSHGSSRSGSFNENGGRRIARMSASYARGSSRRIVRKTLKNSAYYRLMLAMSCSDFIVSFAWFMTTWPIPSDDNSYDTPSEKVSYNLGNMQTCTAQAFFIQLGIVTPFYNAVLSSYYYLTIVREWKEEKFKLRIEYLGHLIAIGFGLGTSFAGLGMKLYNNSVVWCWIAPYNVPEGCASDPDVLCERGNGAAMYRWAFYYGPLWVMIFLVFLFMTMVYAYVRSLDVKMQQYTNQYSMPSIGSSTPSARRVSRDSITLLGYQLRRDSINSDGTICNPDDVEGNKGKKKRISFSAISCESGVSSQNNSSSGATRAAAAGTARAVERERLKKQNERSKAVANQGLFYAGSFAFVWLFGTITRLMQLIGAKPPWPIIFLFAIFTPSQGFFNFLVYIRPRILKYFAVQKKKRDAIKKRAAGEAAASCISTVSMIHVSGVEENEVASNSVSNHDNTNGSELMVEPSTSIRTVPDGIITNNQHTQYARRSSNGSIKRLSNESGLSKLDESIDEETTDESPEEVPKQQKRDSYSKVRFQVANIDVVDEEEDPPSDSDLDSESKSLPSSPARAVGRDAAAEGGITTTTTAAAVGHSNHHNTSSILELSTVLTKLTTQMEEDQKSSEQRAQRTDAHILRLQAEATAQQKMMVQLFQNFQINKKQEVVDTSEFYPVLDDGDVELWQALRVIRGEHHEDKKKQSSSGGPGNRDDIHGVTDDNDDDDDDDHSEVAPEVVQPSSSSLLLLSKEEEEEQISTDKNNNGVISEDVMEEVEEATKEESVVEVVKPSSLLLLSSQEEQEIPTDKNNNDVGVKDNNNKSEVEVEVVHMVSCLGLSTQAATIMGLPLKK